VAGSAFEPAAAGWPELAFVADFEHEVAATEARGGRYPLGDSLPQPVDGGETGKGALIETRLAFATRHHVSSQQGNISLDMRLRGTNSGATDGALVPIGGLELKVYKGVLVLRGGAIATMDDVKYTSVADGNWHSVTLTWLGRDVWVHCDGVAAIKARLNAPCDCPEWGTARRSGMTTRHGTGRSCFWSAGRHHRQFAHGDRSVS
jgi:hypothetical protein